jgi:hypothetical protein
MAIAMLALAGSAFTPKPAAPTEKKAPYSAATLRWLIRQPCLLVSSAPTKAKYDLGLYWYTYPDDSYNDFNTIPNEEWELWLYFGGLEVDTNPLGGTLLEKGYLMYGWPHLLAYSFLYGHYE